MGMAMEKFINRALFYNYINLCLQNKNLIVFYRYFREHKVKQILLNVTFALPFILVILWIKPVSREYLTVRIFSGKTAPL